MYNSKAPISLGCDCLRWVWMRRTFQNVYVNLREFLISSHKSQGLALVLMKFWTCSKNLCSKFSLKMIQQSSQVSRILLNLVSASQRVREMKDNFVRGLATYDIKSWLIGRQNENLAFKWETMCKLVYHGVWQNFKLIENKMQTNCNKTKIGPNVHECRKNSRWI